MSSKAHPTSIPPEVAQLLAAKARYYNQPAFIAADPVAIPHRFEAPADIEIAGFLTATMAWGRRSTVLQSADRLLAAMGHTPYDFIRGGSAADFEALGGFVHRTFQGVDCVYFCRALQQLYRRWGSMEAVFRAGLRLGDTDIGGGIRRFRSVFFSCDDVPARTRKHVADIDAGSAAKRLNMFLRWMIRRDDCGVDLGLWPSIPPRLLVAPLDVHSGRVARGLGLLARKQNDWKAALALTEMLRTLAPADPTWYDYALFGLGIYEGMAQGEASPSAGRAASTS
jgi:uncharacterized protein (TIGR02757 family)